MHKLDRQFEELYELQIIEHVENKEMQHPSYG